MRLVLLLPHFIDAAVEAFEKFCNFAQPMNLFTQPMNAGDGV